MTDPWPIPEGQLCQAKDEWNIVPAPEWGENVKTWGVSNKGQGCLHPATVKWGDVMEFNHGGGRFYCEHCALDAQIAHIEERMKVLDELKEKRLTACT